MDFEDFTLFNIFLKSNKIYLICSILNYPISENNIDIILHISNNLNQSNQNNTSLNNNFYKKIVKDNHEPILILVYDYDSYNPEKEYEISIKYKDKECIKKLINYPESNSNFLAITTLFKNDYNLFHIYYKYYKNQGVDHFYLYYNDKIENLDSKFYNYINTLSDVTLTEWNFRYWNNDNYKYRHHAQLGQIHDAMYRFGKNNSKYMIFNDFDEYFKIKGITIKDYIINKPEVSTFGFCNRWATTVNKDIPKEFPKKFLYGEKHDHGNRSKNILKTSDIETTGIHGYMESITYNFNNPKKILNLDMFHFYNWSNKNRSYDTPYRYLPNTNNYKKLLLNRLM